MTLAPEAPTHHLTGAPTAGNVPDAPVEVRFTTAGLPLAVRYDGHVWPVAADPVHWYGRRDWWTEDRRAQIGSGDLVSVEYWRVQVPSGGTSTELRTFELRRIPRTDQWVLESISDVA